MFSGYILIIMFVVYIILIMRSDIKIDNLPQISSKTVIDLLKVSVAKHKEKPALKVRRKEKWIDISYFDVYEHSSSYAKAIVANEIYRPTTLIIGNNAPFIYYVYFGTMMIGGIPIILAPNTPIDMIEYVVHNYDISVVVVENNAQLNKFLNINSDKLKTILMINGTKPEKDIPLHMWTDFIETGQFIGELTEEPKSGDIATIIITPDKKDIPVYHYQIVLSVKSIVSKMKYFKDKRIELNIGTNERFILYTPLNNLPSQILNIHLPMSIYGTIWIADWMANTSSIVKNIKQIKPTIFVGDTYIWDIIKDEFRDSYNIPFLDHQKFVDIGLDKCKYPILLDKHHTRTLIDFYKGIGLRLCNMYTSNVGIITLPTKSYTGRLKNILPHNKLKVKNNMLYLKTSLLKDVEWINTGDIASNSNDEIRVTGNIKDMIKLTNGKIVNPHVLEKRVLERIPMVNKAVVIGRDYLSVLITLKVEYYQGEPTEILRRIGRDTMKALESKSMSAYECDEDKIFSDYINEQISEINKQTRLKHYLIKDWVLIPMDMTISNGFLDVFGNPNRKELEHRFLP